MGEALIVRKGGGGAASINKGILVTELITENKNWIVPKNVVNNSFSIRIFGGGGYCANRGKGSSGGGGGGYYGRGVDAFTTSNHTFGGGGGGYGNGAGYINGKLSYAGYGGGGCGGVGTSVEGGSGICIIQYYV